MIHLFTLLCSDICSLRDSLSFPPAWGPHPQHHTQHPYTCPAGPAGGLAGVHVQGHDSWVMEVYMYLGLSVDRDQFLCTVAGLELTPLCCMFLWFQKYALRCL